MGDVPQNQLLWGLLWGGGGGLGHPDRSAGPFGLEAPDEAPDEALKGAMAATEAAAPLLAGGDDPKRITVAMGAGGTSARMQ